MTSPLAKHWTLDPDIVFLNHGSFGATPTAILEKQSALRARLEREPIRFMLREAEGMLDAVRVELASFVGADAEDLAFVQNATTGVNAVLRSLDFRAGDALVTTSHAYNACRNALDFVAERSGAKVVAVDLPLPIRSEDEVVERIVSSLGKKSRLLLIDHVTSPTALILPLARIVKEAEARGVPVLVDGAHAPGMVDVDLRALGASYYTANCHKWLCAPKGCALLWVRRDLRSAIRPVSISHGANSLRTDKSRFLLEFDWIGTIDPTPWLCAAESIRFIAEIGGGWEAVRTHNRSLALEAREILLAATKSEPLCPESMIGSMAAVKLPDGSDVEP